MTAALEALTALPARRRVAVLGEMAELGAGSMTEHEAVAALARRLDIEVLAVGTDAYGVPRVGGIDEALAALGPLAADDAVLVKASRVAGLERLAARLVENDGSSAPRG
jgi:UDP-N-acetylmuramoyl-tripeptide--D-alanyl-D-alanine ligase